MSRDQAVGTLLLLEFTMLVLWVVWMFRVHDRRDIAKVWLSAVVMTLAWPMGWPGWFALFMTTIKHSILVGKSHKQEER